jgi:acetyltransferase-like isoleucine patch superfamily enzyme
MKNKELAQLVYTDELGNLFIQDDWWPEPLPRNIFLDKMTYPDTAYSFSTYHSKLENGFTLGFASGNYGHSIFMAGINGKITIGKFVVLECTNVISNLSVTIGDHCMFSWGSVVTDSWISSVIHPATKRKMLETLAGSQERYLEYIDPKPVIVEDNVWVGFDAVILPGVTIGKGAIIGCKTVITEEVPPYAVMAGNPARIIRFLSPNDTEEIKKEALSKFVRL